MLTFFPPYILAPGVYTDTVTVKACIDAACSAAIAGSPANIQVTYTVSRPQGAAEPTLTLAGNSVAANALFTDVAAPPPASIALSSNVPPGLLTNVSTTYTGGGVTNAYFDGTAIHIDFPYPNGAIPGTYTSVITVDACLDGNCLNRLKNAPQTINVTYVIGNTIGGASGYTIDYVPLKANDIVWSASRQRLLASVASTSPLNPDSIAVIDPINHLVESAISAAGNNPGVMELSDDGAFLYTGFLSDRLITRRTVADLVVDQTITLGISPFGIDYRANDIKAAPGSPHTIAVALGPTSDGIMVFDDATPRQNPNPGFIEPAYSHVIEWFGSASTLLGGDTESTGSTLTTMHVDATGAHVTGTMNGLAYGRLHYDNGTLYMDNGRIVDPVASTSTLAFETPPAFFGDGLVVDHALNKAFLMSSIQSAQIWSFNLTTHNPIASIDVPGFQFNQVNVNKVRLIRWGPDGLAVVSADAKVILIRGPFVTQ
jgi:hypothetical protein